MNISLNSITRSSSSARTRDGFAIVGASVILPSGEGLERLWEILINGVDCVSRIPPERLRDMNVIGRSAFGDAMESGYIKRIDLFDNAFFNISPADAALMSPLFRLHLETMWRALEDAGYAETSLSGRNVGVFSGYCDDSHAYDYREGIRAYDPAAMPDTVQGNLLSIIPARLSYYLNLKGPSFVVDGACASSTLALISACNSLRLNQCEMAVVTGGRLIFEPWRGSDDSFGIESSDDRTRSFDRTADGSAAGEAVVALVVKTADQAELDGDRILGIIKGYSQGQDGKTIGVMAPNPEAQAGTIGDCLRDAGLKADDVQYVEAHGTATSVGDSVELMSIDAAFRRHTAKKAFCAVGSIKSNMGHTYGASGLLAVVKCLLALQHKTLPPTIHLQNPTDVVRLEDSPIYLNTQTREWQAKNKRRCLINCFSLSGTNCCLALEEAPEPKAEPDRAGFYPVAMSAKTPAALRNLAAAYTDFIEQNDISLASISYSSLVKRNTFKLRAIVLAQSATAVAQAVRALAQNENAPRPGMVWVGATDGKALGVPPKLIGKARSGDVESLERLCALYVAGADIAWENIFQQEPQYVALPSYPFDRRRFWVGDSASVGAEGLVAGASTETERRVGAIWLSRLGLNRLSVRDNFFALGGDSVKAMSITNAINRAFGASVSIASLLLNPTVTGCAQILESQPIGARPLGKADAKPFYGLSSAQTRIYLAEKLEPGSARNSITAAYTSSGYLDVKKLESSLNAVFERHEILRTAFVEIDGKPAQIIHDNARIQVETGLVADVDEAIAAFQRGYDLTRPPLIRAFIGEIASGGQLFIFGAHHIITDGASGDVIIRELERLYNGMPLERTQWQYKDYSETNAPSQTANSAPQEEAYWLSQFADDPPAGNFPTVHPRGAARSEQGARYHFSLRPELAKAMSRLAASRGATPFMIALSALYILISKYSGDLDITIGSPWSGRDGAQTQDMIGVFINMLPLRCKLAPSQNVCDFIDNVRDCAMGAFANACFGYEQLASKLTTDRSKNRNPLFDIAFIFQNLAGGVINLKSANLRPYPIKSVCPRYDLTLELTPIGGEIAGFVEYDASLYDESFAKAFARHYKAALWALCSPDCATLRDIDILSDAEKDEILDRGRGRAVVVESTVVSSWYQMLNDQPDRTRPAIVFKGEETSLADLECESNRAAQVFAERFGVGGKIVPIMMERSPSLLAALLGVLKSGNCYLPLDPSYPDNRIADILEDVEPRFVIATDQTRTKPGSFPVLIYEDIISQVIGAPVINNCRRDSAAYTIYTSGSTGKPKGVVVTQRGMANFVQSMADIGALSRGDRVLCVTTVSFDIFVLESFAALCAGASVALASEEEAADPELIASVIESSRASVAQFTPSRAQMMLALKTSARSLGRLKTLLIGGEALPGDLLAKLKAVTSARILNMYGPTETTVWSTWKHLADGDTVTVGRPIANTTVCIVDADNHVMPPDCLGEIAIGGAGVAMGYINRPDLTDDRFVNTVYELGKIYKTGDIGRWRRDGDLVCLGRIDQQVKIRGYRVELGEVENAIGQHPGVSLCAALLQSAGGVARLAAFVEPKSGVSITPFDLSRFAAARLPDYMVPSVVRIVERMPITPNGKIDRKKLNGLSVDTDTPEICAPPRTPAEQSVADAWSAVLGASDVSRDDSFFALGGNSLLLIMLLSELNNRMNTEVSLPELYDRKTVSAMAELFEKKSQQAVERDVLPKAALKRLYPLSGAQLRLYILSQIDPQTTKYNVTTAFISRGVVDAEKFEGALRKVIERHEILRTAFILDKEGPHQNILPGVPFVLDQGDCPDGPDETIIAFVRPFDVANPPLLRAFLGKLPGGDHLIIIDMHHLATDGNSADALIGEIQDFYDGREPEPLAYQYKDYSEHSLSSAFAHGSELDEQYWLERFSVPVPLSSLPTTYPRSGAIGQSGARHYFDIGRDLCQKAYAFCESRDATLFHLSLTALFALLHERSGDSDICIGTPTAGRVAPEYIGIIGPFINTLALRCSVTSGMDASVLLDSVREAALEAFSHSRYGYDRLVDRLGSPRLLNRNPLFDVMLIYQANGRPEASLSKTPLELYQIKSCAPKYDLTFELAPADGTVYCHIEYDASLFSEEYISGLADSYLALLESIISGQAVIGEITAVTPSITEINQPRADTANYLVPEPETDGPSDPQTETEAIVLDFWRKTLGGGTFGCRDKFFDVGGNSLLIVMLLADLRERFPVKLSAADLFRLQTVRLLSGYIDAAAAPTRASFRSVTVPPKMMGGRGAGLRRRRHSVACSDDLGEPCLGIASAFLNMLAKLLSLDTLGVNVSVCSGLFSPGDLRAGTALMDDLRRLTRQSGFEETAFETPAGGASDRKLLVVFDYDPPYERLASTFDVALRFSRDESGVTIETAVKESAVNPDAIDYLSAKLVELIATNDSNRSNRVLV